MKKIIRLFYLLALILPALAAFSQKYKKIEDTIKLNKEYVNVSNEVADLKAKLTIAQNDMPRYQAEAKDANSDAVNAASASSNQASRATDGSVSDAKSAKRKASKSYDKAKDSRSAKNKVSDQEDKITRYNRDIEKKQQRLEELDAMRLAIYAKIPTDSIPQIRQ
jgi:chromosome segregation ATPase